jgi:membrane-associated phospholipid phosphatase
MNKPGLMIKDNLVFFLGTAIVLIAGTILLLIDGKSASFLLLNSYHCNWLDIFLNNYTLVGNGLFAICLAICLFVAKKKSEAFLVFFSFLLSGLIVQIVKNLFFSPRPKLFFGDAYDTFFIKGIEFYHNNSFPSGHTATAFATATVLILLSENKRIQIPVLFAALLVGYSRIYLGQHFLLDVLTGALIGIISGMASVYVLQRYRFTKDFFKQFNIKS